MLYPLLPFRITSTLGDTPVFNACILVHRTQRGKVSTLGNSKRKWWTLPNVVSLISCVLPTHTKSATWVALRDRFLCSCSIKLIVWLFLWLLTSLYYSSLERRRRPVQKDNRLERQLVRFGLPWKEGTFCGCNYCWVKMWKLRRHLNSTNHSVRNSDHITFRFQLQIGESTFQPNTVIFGLPDGFYGAPVQAVKHGNVAYFLVTRLLLPFLPSACP